MNDFNWKEFLDFANHAATNTQAYPVSREAVVRIAISRAYYAAHNQARDWYSRNHGKRVSHSQLIDHLVSLPARNFRRSGTIWTIFATSVTELTTTDARRVYSSKWDSLSRQPSA
ncbi:MAG: hypothetical protein ACLFU6_04235 [Candidatus Hydrogenedentota bacterium]